MPEGQTRFGLIDSLRAVAALSIVLYHVLSSPARRTTT